MGPESVQRGHGRCGVRARKPPQDVPTGAGIRQRRQVTLAGCPRRRGRFPGPIRPMLKTAVPASRAAASVSPRGIVLQRVPQLWRADDRGCGHEPDGRRRSSPRTAPRIRGRASGTRSGTWAPLSLDDLRGGGPPGRRCAASSSMVRPHETPMAPAGRSEARCAPPRLGHALAGEEARLRVMNPSPATSTTTAPRNPKRLRARPPAPRGEPPVNDLDPDGRLAQGAVEEPADLEAADPEPLTHLVLGQVQPVVELGRAKHQARLARERLAEARGRMQGRRSSGAGRDGSNVQPIAHVMATLPRGTSHVKGAGGRRADPGAATIRSKRCLPARATQLGKAQRVPSDRQPDGERRQDHDHERVEREVHVPPEERRRHFATIVPSAGRPEDTCAVAERPPRCAGDNRVAGPDREAFPRHRRR